MRSFGCIQTSLPSSGSGCKAVCRGFHKVKSAIYNLFSNEGDSEKAFDNINRILGLYRPYEHDDEPASRVGYSSAGLKIRCRCRPQACKQQQQQWALRSLTREFSSRGRGRATRQQPWPGRQQQRARKASQGTAAACGAAVLAGMVIWQVNQDEAPYTHRKRFMMISRGELKVVCQTVAVGGCSFLLVQRLVGTGRGTVDVSCTPC